MSFINFLVHILSTTLLNFTLFYNLNKYLNMENVEEEKKNYKTYT